MSTRTAPADRPVDFPDLAGGHLLHETQHQDPSAILGQALGSPPMRAPPHPGRLPWLPDRPAPRRQAQGRGASGVAAIAPPLVGQHVAADLEQPDLERAALVETAVVEGRQATQRLEEDLLGDVLGGVVGTCLVEREAVHAGQRTSGTGSRNAADPSGSFDSQTVSIERQRTRVRCCLSPLPEHRGSLSVTPGVARPRTGWAIPAAAAPQLAVSLGSSTRPMNRTVPVTRSRMNHRNGWSMVALHGAARRLHRSCPHR